MRDIVIYHLTCQNTELVKTTLFSNHNGKLIYHKKKVDENKQPILIRGLLYYCIVLSYRVALDTKSFADHKLLKGVAHRCFVNRLANSTLVVTLLLINIQTN